MTLSEWLAHGRALLAEAPGGAGGPVTVTLRNEATGAFLAYGLPASVGVGTLGVSAGTTPEGGGLPAWAFSPLERDVLRALGDEVLQGKQVAAALRVGDNGDFRALMANLVKRGVLESGGEGYRVAWPSLPAGIRQALAEESDT